MRRQDPDTVQDTEQGQRACRLFAEGAGGPETVPGGDENTLEAQENLCLKQAEVTEILAAGGGSAVTGVKTHTGAVYRCKAVILTTGTYLKGKIFIGDISFSGGPDGLFPANRLSDSLREKGIRIMRFKTGTPARINRKTIDFSKMQPQAGDDVIIPFSFENESIEREQVLCWLTWTNNRTHEIIRNNLHRSPLYGGMIEGIGPRYCPSIEDKVVRFRRQGKAPGIRGANGAEHAGNVPAGHVSNLPRTCRQR